MLKQASLSHIKFFSLWAGYDKIISILAILGPKVVFLDQDEVQYVRYSLEVIPDRIVISGEVHNFIGLCNY